MAGPTPDATSVSIWTRFVRDVGVPSVVALALVYFLTQVVRADLKTLQESLTDHVNAQQHTVSLLRELVRVNRIICARGGDTPAERLACGVSE